MKTIDIAQILTPDLKSRMRVQDLRLLMATALNDMEKDFLQKSLYEVLYNNLLLPRSHEIDREEEREVFDGSTESLVQLHKEKQISFAQFCSLYEAQIAKIIEHSKNLPIDKERFFALCDMYL